MGVRGADHTTVLAGQSGLSDRYKTSRLVVGGGALDGSSNVECKVGVQTVKRDSQGWS